MTEPFEYRPNFYTPEETAELFEACTKLDFKREETAWGLKKRYAVISYGTKSTRTYMTADLRPLDTAPDAIKKLLVQLSAHSGKNVNYASVVRYMDGDDHMDWHQHKEDLGHEDQRVWIVSTGAERPFAVKPVGGGKAMKFIAQQGSLITLSTAANTTHLHKVPKCSTCFTPRYAINCKALAESKDAE